MSITDFDFDSAQVATYAQLRRAFAFWPILNLTLGVTGNLTCLFIFLFHQEFKKTSSFIILAYIAMLYTASLLVWNIDDFVTALDPSLKFEQLNTVGCKLVTFLGYTLLQSTAGLMVITCMDRFVSLKSQPGNLYARLPYNSIKSAHVWSVLTISTFSTINVHILVLNDLLYQTTTQLFKNTAKNSSVLVQTTSVTCHEYASSSVDMDFWWPRVHIKLYWVVPCLLIVALNIPFLLEIKATHKAVHSTDICVNMREVRKRNSITILVVLVTFMFLIFNLPVSILWSKSLIFFNLNIKVALIS
jgi:hypothetical protein